MMPRNYSDKYMYPEESKTFNVKQDKSIDSLRLTHNQDIHFHLFPFKASGKTQAPIIEELDDVVSGFFRKTLNLKIKPIELNTLCENIISEMDIENNDIELFREMLQNLFFNGDEFVALNLGLYPYQTCIDNKSVDRLVRCIWAAKGDCSKAMSDSKTELFSEENFNNSINSELNMPIAVYSY